MNIPAFLQHLKNLNRTDDTIDAYRKDLQRFEGFLHETGTALESIDRATADEFVVYLRSHAGRARGNQLAPASIARRLASVSSYLDFCSSMSDGVIKNPFANVKRPKIDNNLPRAVPDDVLMALLSGTTNLRDRAILFTFVYSGLRLAELVQLDKHTIRVRQKSTTQGATIIGEGEVIGKGNRRRTFLLDGEAMNVIADYLRSRGTDNHPALFVTRNGTRISCRTVQHILHKWCQTLGLPRLHCHALRHSFATIMINAGMSSVVLQDLMGHRSPETTGRYFRIRPERKTREYFAAMEMVRLSPSTLTSTGGA